MTTREQAQQKALAYAHTINNGSLGLSDEGVVGKMLSGGYVIERSGNSVKSAKLVIENGTMKIVEVTRRNVVIEHVDHAENVTAEDVDVVQQFPF